MRIALSIEYNGANYFGWQKQKTHKEKTIQYYVDKAISKIADEKVSTICAGRTDTGVHAFSQIVHFDTNKKRLDYKWLNGINSNTPNDIIIKNIYHVENNFHARYSALARTYRYVILNQDYPSTYLSSNALHLNKKISIGKIRSTFKHLRGEKDFSCFRASGCSAKSPVKNIKSLKINKYKNFLYIDITANSFLYHMVRNIVGALIDVGTSKYEPNYIVQLINSRDRKKCGKMVLPNGLYLKNIVYPKQYNINPEDAFPYF